MKTMKISGEKICFQWPDFRGKVISYFAKLRQDSEFTDVTLVSEDGKLVDVHKLVLISGSTFFLKVLTESKHHPHPLIYMRGVKTENLLAMVDFLYSGEANVLLENYDSFLSLAEDLQFKGFTESLPPEVSPAPREKFDNLFEKAPKTQHAVPEDPVVDTRQTQLKPKKRREC